MRDMLAARSGRGSMALGPAGRPGHGFGAAARRLLGVALRHPREIATGLVLGGAGMAIAMNALSFQARPHPAPLFGTRFEGVPTGPAPLPPTRPNAAQAGPGSALAGAPAASGPPAALRTSDPTTTASAPRLAGAAPAGAAPASAAPAGAAAAGTVSASGAPGSVASVSGAAAPGRAGQGRDGIADLIKSGEPAASRAAAPAVEPQKLVAAGQRALAKLGYGPLKSDGLMGQGTRQAIERYERDRRLPVTGEFGPRTARDLAAQSGIPIG